MGDRAGLEAAEIAARRLGRKLKEKIPKGWGFVLVLSSFGEKDEGFKTYLSTIEREGAVKLLREMADAIEGKEKEV